MKPRLIVVGPLPPPVHGVSVSTELILANRELQQHFTVSHLDTSDPRDDIANIGRWDPTNVLLALRSVYALLRMARRGNGVLYLPLSQGRAGFLRDSFFVHVAAGAGWSVAAHLRGSEFREFYSGRGAFARAWIRRTLRKVDSIAVLGQSLTHVLEGLVSRDRIAIVPNGTPDPGPDPFRPQAGPVLYLSNLLARKGVMEAVETALLVLKEEPAARFDFVGAFDDATLRERLLARAGSHPAIRFLPRLTGGEKAARLRSASMLLFPPRLPEGHPRVVLEALAAGLPVVATDQGAIAETVVDGEAGFVLDEPDPELLAGCVLRLLRDEDLRRRMSAAARARYLAHYTQDHADRALAEWLYGLAAARTPSAAA